MAPAMVVPSAHCCAGAPQRLSAERYYSRGTYPAGGARALHADIVFIGRSFFRLGISLALWARQSCCFIYPLGGHQRFITHLTSTLRAPAVDGGVTQNSTPCDTIALFLRVGFHLMAI